MPLGLVGLHTMQNNTYRNVCLISLGEVEGWGDVGEGEEELGALKFHLANETIGGIGGGAETRH